MTNTYNRRLLACCGFLTACVIIGHFVPVLHGNEKRYEIRPEITVPEYKTDLDRVIDAYEHLMSNYMRLAERNFSGIHTNTTETNKKLDIISRELAALSSQIATIQKKLGIEVPQPPMTRKIESGGGDSAKSTD